MSKLASMLGVGSAAKKEAARADEAMSKIERASEQLQLSTLRLDFIVSSKIEETVNHTLAENRRMTGRSHHDPFT